MIMLSDIKKVDYYKDFPKTLSELDWEKPDVYDPRYLYTIYKALQERVYGILSPIEVSQTEMGAILAMPASFRSGAPFNYAMFMCLYRSVMTKLHTFCNLDNLEKCFNFKDGEDVYTGYPITYTESDVSNIIGYNVREFIMPSQKRDYYIKYIKGMYNAIKAMRWILFPTYITSAIGTGSSGGKVDEDEGIYISGSVAEAYSMMQQESKDHWNNTKHAVASYGLYTSTTLRQIAYWANDSDNDPYIKALVKQYNFSSYDTFYIETYNTIPFSADFKLFYIPQTQSFFSDSDTQNKHSWIKRWGKKITLWEQGSISAGSHFKSNSKITITSDDLLPHNPNYFPEKDSMYMYYTRHPGWFLFLDIEKHCMYA